MNTLLIFFALPVATIILAIVLEKIIRCPFLTSATFFAIYLIVTFAVFDASFLVYAIVYTILAFITAIIAEYFFRRCNGNNCCRRCCMNNNNSNNENIIRLTNQDITRIANEIINIQNNDTNCNCGRSNSNNSNCNCQRCSHWGRF